MGTCTHTHITPQFTISSWSDLYNEIYIRYSTCQNPQKNVCDGVCFMIHILVYSSHKEAVEAERQNIAQLTR